MAEFAAKNDEVLHNKLVHSLPTPINVIIYLYGYPR